MANLTASQAVINAGATLTLNDAAASQTVNMFDTADDKAIIIVENENTTGMTATITVAPGDYPSSGQGTLSVAVAPAGEAIIGPLEGVRFKNSASQFVVGVSVTASGTVSNVKIGVIKLP